MIKRFILPDVIARAKPGKAVVIYGPRRVGKTTLLKQYMMEKGAECIMVNGEDRFARAWIASGSIAELQRNIGRFKTLMIDEAQRIPEIGMHLKLIVDTVPQVSVIATGSSAFDLAHQIGEPLVGRKWQFELFPIMQTELQEREAPFETQALLPQRLIFGGYPEVIECGDDGIRRELLQDIVNGYLLKDILMMDGVRKAEKLIDMLKLLAWQIGQEVSLSELGNSVNLDAVTVGRYLDLLAKVFVIVRVSGFSRNLRKEVTKSQRYYFVDNGIRNALINNFNALDMRNDVGQLWENYLFMERWKNRSAMRTFANCYFWRTYDQKELDLVEERDGKLFGYEFTWSVRKGKRAIPRLWRETYPDAAAEVIDRNNYLKFIGVSTPPQSHSSVSSEADTQET